MKILVISDTHGHIEEAERIYNEGDFDMIVHLGDLYDDALMIERDTGARVVAVRGNMDMDYSPVNYRVLKTDFGRILLIHGHREKVKSGLMNLIYRTHEMDCDAVFFGHTHQAFYDEVDGLVVLNPGSLTYPYGYGAAPSYAVVEISGDGDFAAEIFELGE